MWCNLRGNRLGGAKFRRQHPIPSYVVDSYCDSARLVIELDGSQHEAEADGVRTRFLEGRGLEVLRFWDNDVLQDTSAVLARILMLIHERTLTPNPPPAGRGEKNERHSR
jgi:very-short-patch-repair endonuclease